MTGQRGFTLPEMLVALAVLGLLLSTFAALALSRVETLQARAWEEEERRLAALVRQAHRRGRLAADASAPADLQEALPQAAVPLRLPDGRDYRLAVDHDDPRILIGDAAVRARLPRGDLRLPVWRARLQRQLQQAEDPPPDANP